MDDVRFFTIADDEHYLGLVALVNSLRLQGHHDPITVLDLGLTPAQCAELGGECDLVRPAPGSPRNPWLLTPQICQARPARVVVYVDSDVIVTEPLGEVLRAARQGAVCAFPDVRDRWFAEWAEIFGLQKPLRRQRYVNAGFFAFSTDRHPTLLERWEETCGRIVDRAGTVRDHAFESPTALADQDALNALLMSEIDPDDFSPLPAAASAEGPRELAATDVVDAARLVCRRDGSPVMLLHHWGSPKPWQAAAGSNLRQNAYLLCLRRLLNGTDVAVRSTQPRVPWLAPGTRGTVSAQWRSRYGGARRAASPYVRKFLPGMRPRVMRILDAGAQPVRSVRTALDPNLRRAYPWKARQMARSTMGAALVVVGGATVSIVLGTWVVIGVTVLPFVAEAVRLAWNARAGRGHEQSWPRGSLRPSVRNDVDPDHLARCIRRDGPVFKTWLLGSPTVCVADLEFARDLFKVHAGDLTHAWRTVERFVPGGSIREIGGPRHEALRRLRTRTLTAALVGSWEPTLVRHLSASLDAMVASAAPHFEIDPLPFVRDAVLTAWSDLLFGVSPDDPDFAEVAALFSDLDPDRHLYGTGLSDDEIEAKLDRLTALVQAGVARGDGARGAPSLAARMEDAHPGALTDPGIIRDFLFETINTRDDTAGLLMWVLKFLADSPACAQGLRHAGDGQRAAADRVVSETLRLAQSEYLFRRASRQIEFRGAVIPARWLVRVCIRELHRDPAHFGHAGDFDPDRFTDGACGRDVYGPFGIDAHACIGENLSRTTARVFATLVARDQDWVTVRDGAVEMTVERHWAPSSRWRIASSSASTTSSRDDRALARR